ncbi:MAG: universal stress protein [Hydrococcus sp. Prado102]|nr:universal stress protein [Hydrococcus sp. Prado102]
MSDRVNRHEVLTPPNPNGQGLVNRFKKILVAVDYLTSTSELFEAALQLAKDCNSHLVLFHCLQEPISGMPEFLAHAGMGAYSGVYSQEIIELEEQVVREATEELQTWLGTLVEKAKEAGIEATSDYLTGEPGRQICAFAKEWGADLILVGRRGRRGLSELLLGSVSNYVIHQAHCAVLVIQHQE